MNWINCTFLVSADTIYNIWADLVNPNSSDADKLPEGACAQPALGTAHGLNIPCHSSNSN